MEREALVGLTVVLDGLDRLRQALESERSLPEAAEVLVAAAVEIVPGCDGGAVTQWEPPDGATVLHASTPALAALEEAQVELAGPGRAVLEEEPWLRTEPGDPRWPEWGERAAATGVAAAVAFRLHLPGTAEASLTLYGSSPAQVDGAGPWALDGSAEALALLVATVGSIALSGVRRQDQLRRAIASRDVIGQAKGILMNRWKLTAEGAFDVLRRASSDTNIPLRIVAERVVIEGDVPKP